MNGQYLMNKEITVQYAYKKDGKGERHGDEAERMLAAQARKHNVSLPIQPLPPQLFTAPAPSAPAAMLNGDTRGALPSAPAGFPSVPPPSHSPFPNAAPPHQQRPPAASNALPPPPSGLPARPPPSQAGYGGPAGFLPPGFGAPAPGQGAFPPPGMPIPPPGFAPPPGFGPPVGQGGLPGLPPGMPPGFQQAGYGRR